MRGGDRRGGLRCALWMLIWMCGTAAAHANPPSLAWPVACTPTESCWIVNYVDHDPTTGVRDYACGTATYNEPPHNRHQGTDIAIRDLAVMREGTEVRAAADGVVVGMRDGMADVSVRDAQAPAIAGRECGNGVRLDHGGGWTSQYCHLRQGSIAVTPGEHVKAGDRLGLVGLSGSTEYPHLHFQIEKDGAIVDPFVGLKRKAACGLGEHPLWRADVLKELVPYQPTALYLAGFAAGAPDIAAARDGGAPESIEREAPALVLWVDIYNVRAGDVVEVRILDPSGEVVFTHSDTVPKNQARRFVYGGVKRKGDAWTAGRYTGTVRLLRGGDPSHSAVLTTTASVRLD